MGRALDEIMAAFDRREYHELEVDGSPEAAVAAFFAAPAASGRLVGTLLRLRGVRAGGTIAELVHRLGFTELRRSPTEVVFGASGAPWRPSGGIAPFGERRPGSVTIAIDVRGVGLSSERTLLSTETRVLAADDGARRRFLWYWRLVRPFSALIRRRWLRAAGAALARPDTGP